MSTVAGTNLDKLNTSKGVQGEALQAAIRILVRGQVQGVGFRPFIFRLAGECQLKGRVRNISAGVVIEVEGRPECVVRFQKRLIAEPPEAAQIEDLTVEGTSPFGWPSFAIEDSASSVPPHVRVPCDRATCLACREEIFAPTNRRRGYPFTNCTECGPRYSILEGLPYDRAVTGMRHFPMCAACRAEYSLPPDRRFHAEPNACPACGPQIGLWDREGRTIAGAHTAIRAATALLRQGKIVAFKGLGGFQLLVRADRSDAVLRLRKRKHRPSKPLAVMVSSLEVGEAFARIDPVERKLLHSAQNPIVLLDKRAGHEALLSEAVAPNVGTIGLFLPTTPLHHLLLAELGLPVVATSGNRSEEPIVTDEQEAVRRLAGIADAFLLHNRPIIRRVDDSLVRVIAGRPTTLRLARGHAPLPLPALERLAASVGSPPLVATGGHQKTAVAAWTGRQAILAPHVGDLDGAEMRAAFIDMMDDLADLYQFEPEALACDQHPDYFSTRWAFAQNKPVLQVQHHHAHALACMAEHDLLDREVLAVTWDGTGYGSDGTIWGGEFLRARRDGFRAGGIPGALPAPRRRGGHSPSRPGRFRHPVSLAGTRRSPRHSFAETAASDGSGGQDASGDDPPGDQYPLDVERGPPIRRRGRPGAKRA